MTRVDCLTCREALSARIDGEDEPVDATLTDQHLASCAACRSWQARVEQTNRAMRIRQAVPAPDLSAAILGMAVPPQRPQGWWARIALIVVATAQLTLALSQVVGVQAAIAVDPHNHGHLLNESTAWNLALGIGLLWAAFRSRVTSGLIPVLAGFVLVLVPYAVHDLVNGAVTASRVAGHGLLVIALALLIVINRRYPDPAPRHGVTVAHTEDNGDTGTDESAASTTDAAGGSRRRPPLRPAGRHAA